MSQPSVNLDLAGHCDTVLKYAKDYAGSNYAMDLQRPLGALDYIMDPSNGGIKAELTQKGKNRIQARIEYKQPAKACEILTGDEARESSVCDDGIEPAPKEVNINLEEAISTPPLQFPAAQFHSICQDIDSFMREYVYTYLRAMRESLNDQILAKLAADNGPKLRHNGDTVAAGLYTDVELLRTTNGQSYPQFANYQEFLLQDFEKMKFNGLPVLIGAGNLQTFLNVAKMSCCNSNNISYEAAIANAGAAIFKDWNAGSTLSGANRFLMTAFGVSHLLWFNKNVGMGKPNNDLVRHITIPDPIYPGLKWDLDFKWDECDEVWSMQHSAQWDVFNVFQADSFSTDSGAQSPNCDDDLLGVTGIWGYNAVKG
jgi:hypothetical protein